MTTSIIRAGGTGVPGVQTTGGDDGALALKVGPLAATVEALSITSAGNVGIGTAAPATYGTLAVRLATSANVPVLGMSVSSVSPLLNHYITDSGGTVRTLNQIQFGTGSTNSANYQGFMSFSTASSAAVPTERMRIDASGNLLLGDSANANTVKLNVRGTGSNHVVEVDLNSTSSLYGIFFTNPNGTVGNITVGGSATAYNTSSDYRLKENVNYDWIATERLKQLKPAQFNFISDTTNTLQDGFLAHEVSSVVPQAVFRDKDEVDDDGTINPQQLDHSKLVPLLVKTIQELEARITELENA